MAFLRPKKKINKCSGDRNIMPTRMSNLNELSLEHKAAFMASSSGTEANDTKFFYVALGLTGKVSMLN